MGQRKLKARRSPAMVVAILALVAALAGSAFAGGGLTGQQKKQVNKIALKVFNSRIGGAAVARAGNANTADHAKSADTTTQATNAAQLGGRPASDYQARLQSSCPGGAIESIGAAGEVACTTPVTGVVAKPSAGEVMAKTIAPDLRLESVCHSGGQVEIVFANTGPSAGILGWFYGDGTGATFASGAPLAAEGERAFSFAGARIAGTFTFSVEASVTTVDLSVFDATSYCRVLGTAVTASG